MKRHSPVVATALALAILVPLREARAIGASDGPELGAVRSEQFSLSLRGSVGYLNGEARELVYDDLQGGSTYKVSELIWDLQDIVMAGIHGTARITHRFHLRAGYWTALTDGNGQMEDFDWLLYEEGSPWTDWSLSDVEVKGSSILDVNLAVDILEYKGIALRGVVGVKQDHWAWDDFSLRHIYSTDPSVPGGFRDDVSEDPYTTGIEYKQTFRMPYLGAEAEYRRGEFEAGLHVAFSPLVSADDEDYHVYRDILFEESFSGGTYFGIGLQALYTLRCGFYFAAGIDYQVIPEFTGDMTVTDLTTGESWSSSGSAGISHEAYMLSLSLGLAL